MATKRSLNDPKDNPLQEEGENVDVVEDFAADDQRAEPVKASKEVSAFQVIFSIFFYVAVSLSTVFINKYIFSYMRNKFDFPLAVTSYQVLFSAITMIILCPLNQRSPEFQKYIKLPQLVFSMKKVKACLVPCLIFTLMISFNNFCLSFVDVTLYLVFRSLTVLFSVLMTYFILHIKSGLLTILSLVVVSVGYIVGSAGGFSHSSYSFSTVIYGLICGTFSSFFVALNSIFAKKVIKNDFNNDFWEFLAYQNVVSFFMFFIVSILSGEIRGVLSYEHYFEIGFIVVTLGSCCFGFLINIAYNLLIKSTTPLTKETVATAKACLQPLLGSLLFGEELNFLSVLGAIICVFGSFLYSLSKIYGK